MTVSFLVLNRCMGFPVLLKNIYSGRINILPGEGRELYSKRSTTKTKGDNPIPRAGV